MKKKNENEDPFKSDRERNDALNKAENRDKRSLPGDYPANEDIMNQKGLQREAIKDDDVTFKGSNSEFPQMKTEEEDLEPSLANEFDVTEDDLEILGSDELSMDGGDDEALSKRAWPVDMAGDDLDVPGSELDNDSESIGSEDEENNPYSLGGDNHEDDFEGE